MRMGIYWEGTAYAMASDTALTHLLEFEETNLVMYKVQRTMDRHEIKENGFSGEEFLL